MPHIHIETVLTREQLFFLNNACPNMWTECNDIINVNGYINIECECLTEIPVQFGQVIGNVSYHNNKLTTLKGSPSIIEGFFACSSNQLFSLEGAPKEIGSDFSCSYNQLTSLEGGPKLIKGDLYCRNNPVLYILYGIGSVEGRVYYEHENDLNEWIIQQARSKVFLKYTDIVTWIKSNNRLEYLAFAPKEITLHFSPMIRRGANLGLYI